jgi:hypothetical protein
MTGAFRTLDTPFDNSSLIPNLIPAPGLEIVVGD